MALARWTVMVRGVGVRYVIVTGGVSVRVVTVRDVPVRRVIVYGPRGKMNVPQRIMRVYSQRLVPVRLVPVAPERRVPSEYPLSE